MNQDPKIFQKLPLGWNQKQWTNFENLEKGEQQSKKGRPLDETLKEDTKSHLNIP